MRVFAGIETLKVDANEGDRTLTEENLDDDIDDTDTLHDSEGKTD